MASRRACEVLVEEGRVVVNGKKAQLPQQLVDLSKDKVRTCRSVLYVMPGWA